MRRHPPCPPLAKGGSDANAECGIRNSECLAARRGRMLGVIDLHRQVLRGLQAHGAASCRCATPPPCRTNAHRVGARGATHARRSEQVNEREGSSEFGMRNAECGIEEDGGSTGVGSASVRDEVSK
jgi:hypothetical protein